MATEPIGVQPKVRELLDEKVNTITIEALAEDATITSAVLKINAIIDALD